MRNIIEETWYTERRNRRTIHGQQNTGTKHTAKTSMETTTRNPTEPHHHRRTMQ